MEKTNFISLIETSIIDNWDNNAFTDIDGNSISYKEVATKIGKLHDLFEANKIKPDDKISLIGRNSYNWAIAFFATITYGAVIVPILPDFHPNDIHHIVNHSDSVILFCADQILNKLNPAEMKSLKGIFSLTDFSKTGNNKLIIPEEKNVVHKEDINYVKRPNDNLALLSYTSGTTGFSKGVMLSYNSLIANVSFAQKNMPLQKGDNMVSFLPLAHSYGLAFEFLFPFTLGCHIHFITKPPSPQVILQAFQTVKPKLVLMIPLIIEKIYKKQLQPKISKFPLNVLMRIPLLNLVIFKSINKKLTNVFGGEFHELIIGGAALNKDVEKFLRKIKFKFTIGYGMTECGPLISYSSWKKTKLTSAGCIVDSLQIKIDSDDMFKQVGEIMVRGDNVMLGYYKNNNATEAVLEKDGWLHTGDLGVIDKNNTVYIRGRSKSMILGSSGQNIYPEEIEAKINNMPYVQESVVISDNKKLIALAYPEAELAEKNNLSNEDILKIFKENLSLLNKELPKYMQVSDIQIHENEFEKTPKKSIKRFLYQPTTQGK